MPATNYALLHRDGEATDDPPLEAIGPLLQEVADGGGAVGVRHSSGWVLTIRGDGVVVFGHDTDRKIPDRHLTGAHVPAMVDLAIAIAVGSVYETLDHEWKEGPIPPLEGPGEVEAGQAGPED